MKDSGTRPDAFPGRAEHEMIIRAGHRSTVVAMLHGDMHIRDGHPVYQVMPFPRAARRMTPEEARQQPSRLLTAESQVVPFAGRQQELAHMVAWRDDPEPGVSVMLVHGPGGQGKTRLAARFAAESARTGWSAWSALHLSDPSAHHVVAAGDPGQDLVLVADYADRWPTGDLLLLLNNPLLRYSQRTRVLLIARSASIWWPSVRHRLDEQGFATGPGISLPPLAETPLVRREIFASAREAFASALAIPAQHVPVPGRMDDDAFRLVLTVHMAALVAVDAYRRGIQPARDPVGLSSYLLDRERDFWLTLHDHEQIAITPAVMGRAVYAATLTRQLDRSLAVAVIQRTGVADAAAAPQVLDDHAACYPPAFPGASLEPLSPDRLGEDFLALTTPGHSHPGYHADPWAESAPARLLAAGHQPLPYTRAAVTALIDTARRWPHVTERQLNPLLQARPGLAVEAGGAALAGLADLPEVDIKVFEAVESQLPPGRHVDLDAGIAAVTARLTTQRLVATSDAGEQADLYHTLGRRFVYAGLSPQALTATAKAAEIRERLAADAPAIHEPGLALSLDNLSAILSDLGHREQALTVTRRAVEMYRRLTSLDAAAYEPGLARALLNLAAHLTGLGRLDDALVAIGEAAGIRKRLAADDPARHEPDLAVTMNNAAVIFARLGRRDLALVTSRQAAQTWQRLAGGNPSAYSPDHARALSNLAADLADTGRPQEALEVTGQAVDVYRKLTRASAAYESGLAMALSNLAAQLTVLGHPARAFAAADEALQIRRRLAADSPAANLPDLAASLDRYGVTLAGMTRMVEAQAAIGESVEIRQRLAIRNPAAYEPALAESLSNLAKVLTDSERDTQASAAARHAVDIYRRLAASNPVAHEPGLARALNTLGVTLQGRRQRRQALSSTSESLSIYRRLTGAAGAAHEPGMASALLGFAAVRAAARTDLPAALKAAVEAVQVLERVTKTQSSASTEPVLAAYAVTAEILDQLGDRKQAAAMRRLISEAVRMLDDIAAAERD